MPVFRTTQFIDAPPQVVWDLVCDLERGPEYVDVMIKLVSASDDPIKVGTVYRELSQIGPSTSETEWTITELDPPEHLVHVTRSFSFGATLTGDLEPQGEGTKLTYNVDYQLLPGLRPVGWLLERLFVRRMMDKDFTQTVANLKSLVETGNV
jgi:carbon monoxide dehydrogenase subunit G